MKKLQLCLTVVAFLVLSLLVAACGDSPATSTLAPAATNGAQSLVLDDNLIQAVRKLTNGGDFSKPLDSVADPEGGAVYFTASGPKGQGVFKVAATGGVAGEVFSGAPFVAPRTIVMSSDGKQLFVADPQSGIFTLAPGGGTPSPLAGSQNTAPQNLDIVMESGQNFLYFSGKDPASGQPAILKLPVSGATAPTVITKGAPLVTPDGIAVAQGGVIYVADRTAAGSELGKIFKFEGGTLKPIVEKVKTGFPAGIALTPDQSLLLVSALQADKPNDQVLLVNLANLQTGSVTKVVGENKAAAGLHLSTSTKQPVFSWADSAGTIYLVGTKKNPLP